MQTAQNFERIIAESGFSIVEKVKNENKKSTIINVLNKSIGILQENGIYAFFLWLTTRSNEEKLIGLAVYDTAFNLIEVYDQSLSVKNADNKLAKFMELKDLSLDKLLFIKKLIVGMLTYALYRAKAIDKIEEQGENNE